MMNLSGVVDSSDVNHGKLQVSVDIFGRPTPVELEFWQVERDDRN
jgi:transcriptional antiterminator NusG